MTDSGSNLGPFTEAEQRQAELTVKENTMPEGANNPNYPSVVNPERERREEDRWTDAILFMEAARRVEELQTFLNSLTPASDEFANPAVDARCMAGDMHDHLEETVREVCPEAYRDWLAKQASRAGIEMQNGLHALVSGGKSR